MTILSALLEAANANRLCGEPIRLDGDDPRYNTYCMRPRGHQGKHHIEKLLEDIPSKPEPKLSKEAILKDNYGPYSKNDPRATRGF